jgi:hypothetical protein
MRDDAMRNNGGKKTYVELRIRPAIPRPIVACSSFMLQILLSTNQLIRREIFVFGLHVSQPPKLGRLDSKNPFFFSNNISKQTNKQNNNNHPAAARTTRAALP